MKRLIFLTTFDYPSRYAHAIHGEYMARAFCQKFGENFLFFINTAKKGAITGVPYRLLFGRFGRRVKLLHLRSMLLSLVLLRFFGRNKAWQGSASVVFINDPKLIRTAVWLKRVFKINFIFESHGSLSYAEEGALAEDAARVIFLTSFLEHDALVRHPELKGRTVTLSNAVDVALFEQVIDNRNALRKELSLPEGFLVGYIGRFEPLGTDKGLRLMIEALKALPHNINLVLVGGTKDEVVQYTNIALKVGVLERVTIVSHIAPSLVPKYQKACDVLAYVPRGHTIFYEKETSPMKIFEYMAAKRPMILSSVPTSTALVPSDAAYFAEPGSVQSFIEVVCNVERNSVEAGKRAERAFALVRENTWGRRAERILKDLS